MIDGTPLKPVWDKIGARHHHGIAVPLASIRTEDSNGIGEFGDLCHLIDFCKKAHLDTIQLLPINDSGTDPSPYNALSSMALHPIYLSTHALPGWKKIWWEEYRELNKTQHVEYHKVLALKDKHLRLYFEEQFP
ncbi:MAG: 4-alpha-glucanotransferase, partial [Simkaniaceae bacterium]|nr:4-alpha-glucanotransferase [Simkaniaceae bacterium]